MHFQAYSTILSATDTWLYNRSPGWGCLFKNPKYLFIHKISKLMALNRISKSDFINSFCFLNKMIFSQSMLSDKSERDRD